MRRWIGLLMSLVILFTTVATALAAEKKQTPDERFAPEQTQPTYVEVPGKGMMRYYAQNDDLWRRVGYESDKSKKYRPFGDGGCAPTSLAIILANIVPAEQLDDILDYGVRPFSLCEHHINSNKCSYKRCRERYELNTPERVERFLPLVFADFAMGNNSFGILSRTERQGTDPRFIPYVAQVYGLNMTEYKYFREVEPILREGKIALAYCVPGSMFSNGGHYLVIVAIDDEKLYLLDPIYRESYKTTYGKKVERISPGLIAISLDDIRFTEFSYYYVFDVPESADEPATSVETAE